MFVKPSEWIVLNVSLASMFYSIFLWCICWRLAWTSNLSKNFLTVPVCHQVGNNKSFWNGSVLAWAWCCPDMITYYFVSSQISRSTLQQSRIYSINIFLVLFYSFIGTVPIFLNAPSVIDNRTGHIIQGMLVPAPNTYIASVSVNSWTQWSKRSFPT